MKKKTKLTATSYKLQAESKPGLVYVFTGEGKGKTSAALGTALRAAGAGMRVAWVAWYKQASWRMSEIESLEKLRVEVYLMGKGFNIRSSHQRAGRQESGVHTKGLAGRSQGKKIKTAKVGKDGVVVDTASEEEHKKAAREALKLAGEILSSRHKSGLQDDSFSSESLNLKPETYNLLILDEVNNAVAEGLVEVQEVLEVLEVRGGAHVVLTGRDVHPEIVEVADLVTECVKLKHPYDKGKLAVRGLDF